MSLRKRKGFKFFDAYSESVKGFKGDFLYVVPANKDAMDEVVSYAVAGKIDATQFHFDWVYDHFLVKTNTFTKKESQLGVADQKTLRLLPLWMLKYTSGKGLIDTKSLVQAGNSCKLF